MYWSACRLFFFQAEDGIRYLTVTGVQTCALPIYATGAVRSRSGGSAHLLRGGGHTAAGGGVRLVASGPACDQDRSRHRPARKIGRASCRERVLMLVVALSVPETIWS